MTPKFHKHFQLQRWHIAGLRVWEVWAPDVSKSSGRWALSSIGQGRLNIRGRGNRSRRQTFVCRSSLRVKHVCVLYVHWFYFCLPRPVSHIGPWRPLPATTRLCEALLGSCQGQPQAARLRRLRSEGRSRRLRASLRCHPKASCGAQKVAMLTAMTRRTTMAMVQI